MALNFPDSMYSEACVCHMVFIKDSNHYHQCLSVPNLVAYNKIDIHIPVILWLFLCTQHLTCLLDSPCCQKIKRYAITIWKWKKKNALFLTFNSQMIMSWFWLPPYAQTGIKIFARECVCVCVCVCMWERDKNSLLIGIGSYSVINQQGQTQTQHT